MRVEFCNVVEYSVVHVALVVKTTSSTATVLITNNGNITFTTPFIEQASSADLISIGPDGKEFLQSSECTITVFNLGSIIEQVATNEDSTIFYILGAIAVILIVIAFFVIRRKKRANVSAPFDGI